MRYSPWLLVVLALGACAPHKPLAVFPSAEQEHIMELEKENASLRQQLEDLTKSCTAVLRIFREAGSKSRLPARKEK